MVLKYCMAVNRLKGFFFGLAGVRDEWWYNGEALFIWLAVPGLRSLFPFFYGLIPSHDYMVALHVVLRFSR